MVMVIIGLLAGYAIPNEKFLRDAGWEFKSDKRLPKDTENFLFESLKLKFVENFSGVAAYEGDALKAAVISDDSGEIENVYLKLYGMTKERLSSHAELFFPPEN